jgi:DNA-binding MarR family transcriptional regulator
MIETPRPAANQGSSPIEKEALAELNNEFLSSARVFAWSVREILEKAVLREVAREKLTFPQLKLLYLVAHTDEHTTVGDAAAFLGISNAAASKAVEKLVRRRLLRRTEIQEDRRSSQLSLTEASRKLLEAYEAARDDRAAKAFEQFSIEELKQASELLDRLAGAIVNPTADPAHVCMQCEIYYREKCRFGELGRRNCFYQRRKREKHGLLPQPGEKS